MLQNVELWRDRGRNVREDIAMMRQSNNVVEMRRDRGSVLVATPYERTILPKSLALECKTTNA